MRNVIIDCDPGHDDAIAILMAIANSDKINIKGITTVGGNHILEKITDNALKILSLVNEDIKLAKGAKGPLFRKLETGANEHGDSGMDGPIMDPPKYKPIEKSAIEFMREIICNSKEKITLVPIGPLTNIAILFKTYPEVKENIELISLMGGGVSVGNVTPMAEFNIYVDPEAAKIVFDSGIPIVMSGLDVTHKALIYFDEIDKLKEGGKVSRVVGELLDFYSLFSKKHGFKGSALHDPCAIAYLLQPELFKYKDLSVDVETKGELTRGMTVADNRLNSYVNPNVRVLLDVDRDKFVNIIFEALEKLDKRF